MASREELDAEDDDFRDIYKAYTGPVRSNAPNVQDKATTNKRSHGDVDEEQETYDPNAVPTDFTSREAKFWEAKSKATERNWKKKKEEEMICKICGESGHFTQGCPSTLGANRKSQDFFERVPARDPHVKSLFSADVVNKIEKDIGCKIKIEEKFIIVSGKDRLILRKGVDAVHKVKEEGESKGANKFPDGNVRRGSPSSPISQSRSVERRSPITSRLGRSDSQKSYPSPQTNAHVPLRYGREEKVIEDHVREDLQKLSSRAPHAYGNGGDRGRGRSGNSKSPSRPSYTGNSYSSYESQIQMRDGYRTNEWNNDKGGVSNERLSEFNYPFFPQTLEELELQYTKEATELERIRDREEDEENAKHCEALREIRDNHIKKVGSLKGTHAHMWDEFLRQEAQNMQQSHHQIPAPGFGSGYKQTNYREFDDSSGNQNYSGTTNVHSRLRYPSTVSNYTSSRSHNTYDDFHRQRRDDFGKPYNHRH